jgi:hypothetical protein
MAFFATLEDLPRARAQWSPGNVGDPNSGDPKPNVPKPVPPRVIPPRTPPQHHCTDGHKRVLMTKYGRGYWTCVGPIPYAYRSLINTRDQIRGRRKPGRTPRAVQEDRTPTRRTTRGYLKGKYRYYFNEDVGT